VCVCVRVCACARMFYALSLKYAPSLDFGKGDSSQQRIIWSPNVLCKVAIDLWAVWAVEPCYGKNAYAFCPLLKFSKKKKKKYFPECDLGWRPYS
jgi:hypothetical protein